MKLVIAGGGTGGHIFPAIAIAEYAKENFPDTDVLFIGTKRGIEKNAVPKAGFKIEFIDVSGLKGHSLWRKIKALLQLPSAILRCLRILRREKPTALIGVGGYASGPAMIAAVLLRIPSAIIEPNSIPGFTNRVLSPFARQIFCAFSKTGQYFPAVKTRIVGTPLRKSIAIAPPVFNQIPPLRILVVGGSQGARALNETVPLAAKLLKDKGFSCELHHQTGKHDYDKVKTQYQNLNLNAKITPFIENMGQAYRDCQLVICRSGAGTIAELTAAGLPSILVPFPKAIYDHQTFNAKELSDNKAAILIPQSGLSPQSLSDNISKLFQHPEKLGEMSKNTLSLQKNDASSIILKEALNGFKPSFKH